MSITFGLGTFKIQTDDIFTGGVVTTATTSGTTSGDAANLAVSSGLVLIDGVTATLSANADVSFTEAGATGTGLLIYAHLNGNSSTAAIAIVTAGHPINTSTYAGTAICRLANFSYGTGATQVSTINAISGSATKTVGKVQNVSINISYETSQMRGGSDVFPCDTKFFDGSVEGSFEFGDFTAQQSLPFGGVYSSGGTVSGTWTVSGNSRPNPVTLVLQNTTNGVTATYTIRRAYLTSQTNDFGRTDYMQPSWSFIAQANGSGSVIEIQK